MAIKPILFSTPMVQAILAKRKGQTRRLIKFDSEISNPQKIGWSVLTPDGHFEVRSVDDSGEIRISFGKERVSMGDILWVRETWAQWNHLERPLSSFAYKADGFIQRYAGWERDTPNGIADVERIETWKPSIFMPKEAARIFLKVTNVRVERLQDITDADAIDEGIEIHESCNGDDYSSYPRNYMLTEKQADGWPYLKEDEFVESFKTLWQSINGRESWEANPWVWVYEFEQIEKPKDFGNE